jgi:hypothetical protein
MMKAHLRLRRLRHSNSFDNDEWNTLVSSSKIILSMLGPNRDETHTMMWLEHQARKQAKSIEMEDICSICLEYHTRADTIVTCCGHSFGRKCLSTVVKMARKQRKQFHCPICRRPQPSLSKTICRYPTEKSAAASTHPLEEMQIQ